MTTSVDVLAVMARDAELALNWNGRAKEESQTAFRESQEARAAVAELIASIEAERSVGFRKFAQAADARRRTGSALARVKGA